MERHPQQKFIKDSHELRYSSNAPSHELEEIEDGVSHTKNVESLPYHPSGTSIKELHTQHEQVRKTSKVDTTDRSRYNNIVAEKKAANRYRWKLMIGLFFPFSVQALDITIIASAAPFIASDFRTYFARLSQSAIPLIVC